MCEDIELIFVETEKIIRKKTASFSTKINQEEIVEKALQNSTVLEHFKAFCDQMDNGESIWAEKMLEKILDLYCKVRSHSYAKDVKERFKVKATVSRKRALRKELKITTDKTDCSGH